MTKHNKDKSKDTITMGRSLRTKLNIYLALIVIITIVLFNMLALKFSDYGFYIHIIHAVVTVLLIIGLVNFMFSKLILTPLNNLIEAMSDMGGGKFTTPLEAESNRKDEIGWLINRFGKMRENILELVREEKRQSASSVTYRMHRELEEPVNNLEQKVESLRSKLDRMEPGKSREYIEGIVDGLEKDLGSIKTFSEDLRSMFT